jgi:hypothetical protein
VLCWRPGGIDHAETKDFAMTAPSTPRARGNISVRTRLQRAFAAAVLAVSVAGAAAAGKSLQAPAGAPILTIGGAVEQTNDGEQAVFDRAMLEALGTVTIETTTPWTEGVVQYEGVPVARVLAAVGAQGEHVVATALNAYTAEIPVADFADERVILALKENGAYLTARNKGPLFIVYPYDADPAYRSERYFTRSVWQLTRLEVR